MTQVKLYCFGFLILFSSCFRISASLVGLKQREPFKEKKMVQKSYQYMPQAIQVATFDTISYTKAGEFFKNDQSKFGTFVHPMFYMIFYPNDSLASFMAICDTDIHGALKMTWRDNNMNVFPPVYHTDYKQFVTFSEYYSWLNIVNKKADLNKESIKVVVMWSRFVGRQRKYLTAEIQQNLKLTNQENVDIIVVNCDDLMAVSSVKFKGKRK